MLGNILLGHVTGEPYTNPTSTHMPRLTSVKKPAIPAWHEPCSSPYFFLYSGGKKGRKQTVVIPSTADTLLHLSHLHCYLHKLERHQHARLLGFISGSATNVHHAAHLHTSGSIARSQLGREARVLLQRC